MLLNEAQLAAVERGQTVPVLIDGIACVVLRADVYNHVKRILEHGGDELQPEDTYPAGLEAWDADGSSHDAEDYRA